MMRDALDKGVNATCWTDDERTQINGSYELDQQSERAAGP